MSDADLAKQPPEVTAVRPAPVFVQMTDTFNPSRRLASEDTVELILVRHNQMNRSIILAALIVGAAILLNGQLEKISRFRPHPSPPVKAGAAAVGKSVAVLPFQDLGGDLQNSQSLDGLREEIVAELTKLTELKVVDLDARQVRQGAYTGSRELGRELDVAYIVRGTVQREGNRVRVRARLIKAEADQTVWTETYDLELSDVFSLDAELAQKIAEQLRKKITSGDPLATAPFPRRLNQAVQLAPLRLTPYFPIA